MRGSRRGRRRWPQVTVVVILVVGLAAWFVVSGLALVAGQ